MLYVDEIKENENKLCSIINMYIILDCGSYKMKIVKRPSKYLTKVSCCGPVSTNNLSDKEDQANG
jgi:hypothetical protein